MMQPQVFISGLILLLPGIVGSSLVVKGVTGDPVTLPCTYSTHLGITTACWGLGDCQSYCIRTLIWTDGYRATYQRSSRYQLKGNISEGNVSLTIENAVQSDNGPYCCTVEIPGSFSYVTYSLEVKPEIPTRPTTTERPTTTGRPTTLSIRPTHVPTSPKVSTSTPSTPAHTQTHTSEPTTSYPGQTTAEVTETASYTPADWNNTVTPSDDSWNNDTDFYIDISTTVLLLVLLVCTAVITSYILKKKKSGPLSLVAFRVSKIGALQNTEIVWP